MNSDDRLLTMRLIDMHKLHPAQDNSRRCFKCGWGVGIYPSGQKILREHPDLKIICNVCADFSEPVINFPAAKSIEELMGEIRDSIDVKKA